MPKDKVRELAAQGGAISGGTLEWTDEMRRKAKEHGRKGGLACAAIPGQMAKNGRKKR